MDDPIGIGVIGCGQWGMNYVRVFSELSQATVVAAGDVQAERLRFVQQRFPTVETCGQFEQLLGNPEIQGLAVSTPATAHYAIVRECLLSRKHVLVEKPITTDIAQAEELVALAEKMDVLLMVGHTFLYNGGIRKMKTCIDDADFGTVYYLHAIRTNLGPIREDVNAIWDLAPHDVAIFDYLLDCNPTWVSAVGMKVLKNSREDVGFVTLRYPGDIVGNIHVSWADPYKVRTVIVVGSKKRICFDDLNSMEQVRVFEKGVTSEAVEAGSFGEFRLLVRDGDIVSPKIEASEPLKNQCAHFLDCIRTGAQPLTNGQHALEVVKVMAAIQESITRNGGPVQVE
jgi:predicted dehydrogenase